MTPPALFPWQSPADIEQVYFDCNATTPTLPVAARAALATMEACFGNPSSAHMTGLQAKHLLESTRALARKVMGACKASSVVFTSGATEGIQMAVFSALERLSAQDRLAERQNTKPSEGSSETPRVDSSEAPRVLLYGATEHKAVPQALKHWVQILGLDLEVKAVPVDARGLHDLEFLREHLPRCPFLATMAVNNETGVISDLAGIAACLREADAATLWLVDCVQALGKIPLTLAGSRIDYATFSGHKLYAPKGVGVLYARPGVPLVPLIVGGGQEGGVRSGTENLPGVAALGEILRELETEGSTLFATHDACVASRNALAAALREHFPGIVFNAPFEVAVPTTLNFSIPGFSSREMLDLFDAVGMRLSAGSACSAAKALRSDILDAMGVPEWRSLSAVRMSFGPATPADEIERGVRAIDKAARALKDSCLYPGQRAFPAGAATPLGAVSVPSRAHGVVQFPAGSANSWVVTCGADRTCVLIDPCPENSERILHFLECQGLKVLAVLDTHLHADHTSPR
ncbi:MAG: aminotransferase class V-fold PLP-dependent enzyme, partial [Silvanigrellales bacterium]|nr:aminotransferase class V-fold PLP-dependent enzyme [Silvanigrellales bacterium]